MSDSTDKAEVNPQSLFPYPFTEPAAQRREEIARVVWFTGLSGAGKSTIADTLAQRLRGRAVATTILDGDSLRKGLCSDLGFAVADREENVRRVAEVAALMADAGLTVLVALISPTVQGRARARAIVGTGRFVEAFIDVPLSVAEGRDPKGLYRRARSGALTGFTGIDSPYEAPAAPELHIHADRIDAHEAAASIEQWLRAAGHTQDFSR